MVKKRTEEDKLCQAPIKVTLAGETWDVKPLSIRKAREWRATFANALAQLPKWVSVTTDDAENFEKAMNAMLVELPELVGDLFFGYAQDLDREALEEIATDAELAKAFEEVAAFALPLTGTLIKVMGKTAEPSPPEKSSSTS